MFQSRDLSLVQLKILSNFIRKTLLTYTEGRPEDITNDLYKYHLGFLIEKGVVKKVDGKYLLTDYGKGIVQNLDIFGKLNPLFKVSVLIYAIRMSNGVKELLMQKRKREPYFGDIEVISGKIKPGETIESAGNRRLKEETGLSANLTFVGVIRKIRIDKNKEIFEDSIYHVCFGSKPEGTLIENNEFGENMWVDIKKALDIVKKNKTYGKYTEEIIKRVEKGNYNNFYLTEKLTLREI